MRGLQNKVIIITGGARGIGASAARRLSEEGSKVVLVDLDGDEAKATAESLPGEAIGVAADVSKEKDVEAYHRAALDRFGRIDGVHLNAGIGGQWGVGLADTTMDDYDRVLAIDLRGVYLGMRQALRDFRTAGHGGSIVTTASSAGIVGGEWVSPYVAAKHGVVGLTKTGAVNGGPLGVRVNCVAPGLVVTRLTLINESVVDDAAEARAAQIATVPLGREGSPDDIASVVAFLLSDDSSYVSGVVIPVDGASLADHPRARALANLSRAGR
jgi:NAD(P)-dependent dehydrogenase (short-subunit alcohol dehydrogenase family)